MSRSQDGSSLVELLVALSVFVVGVLGLAGGFLGTTRLAEDSRDNTLLDVATGNIIATLRGVPYFVVVDEFGPGSGKDQFWCSSDGTISLTDPGNAFATGQIEFFNNESAIPGSFAGTDGGFDLNGNGVVDSGPVSDYILLPVRTSLTIPQPGGSRVVNADFFLVSW